MKKALVVGAGFAGAVVARELAEAGWQVLVVDQRNHVGGNAYDYVNELGIRVHKYGPHLWHGNSDMAQEWVSRFTEWLPYMHWVHAQLPNGKPVPLPINRYTIEEVFEQELYDQRECMSIEQFMETKRVKMDPSEVTNSRQHVEMSVGKELCELFFAPYTKKMWGMPLEDLPASVAARIPTKTNYDPYYFPNDKHQYLPKDGYTAIFEKIFDHPNITLSLCTARQQLPQFSNDHVKLIPGWEEVKFDVVFTSEPIDTYYEGEYGALPWRSIKCHTFNIPLPKALSAPVVNFTHDGPHTRVTEWKQFPGHDFPDYARDEYSSSKYWTTLTVEEPCDYVDNNYERYYPVKTSHAVDPNREIYKRYRARAQAGGIHFIGRCGRYVYTDMQPCVNSTLTQVRRFLAGDKIPVED